MEISSRLPTASNRAALCDLIVKSVDDKCPDVKLFIREYDSNTNTVTLIGASSSVPPDARVRLHRLEPERIPMLAGALRGNVRICNSPEEIAPASFSKEDRDLRRQLQFHRGVSFPLSDSLGNLFGTISMYRREIDPPFTALEAHYAGLISKQIADSWTARKERQQGLAYSRFLTVFTRCEDENELYKETRGSPARSGQWQSAGNDLDQDDFQSPCTRFCALSLQSEPRTSPWSPSR